MVSRHVVTLANSIVGVSVLAMPFCFKQCGIVLATVCLMVGAVMTRMVCYFLLKAAVMSRRRTYEMLAWSTFGQTGKFLVEISIIGFLIGTLIAFMVVIGDLGPEILSEMFSFENNSSLRTIIMTALSLFVALPLGLLRNIDSLNSVSTASVLFYLFLVIKIVSEGFGPLWSGEYLQRIHFWRSAGVLQCIPIFSMALSCQTQVFGIYEALPEPSLQKMNEVVKKAVYICTFFYFCVGFFGYIAFSHHQNFAGNILLSFEPAWSTQIIKSMFLMSVVFSVPLVVFPCRASLHSLMFRSATAYHHVHDMSTNYIPESRMKFLTITIVGFTLVIGILIPNIELVLGLVGSTTGSVICIIFPSVMFVRVTSKSTTERLLAQFMFFVGVTLMFLTTYATLYAAEQTQIGEHLPEQLRVTDDLLQLKPILKPEDTINSPASKLDDDKLLQLPKVEFERKGPEKVIANQNYKEKSKIPAKLGNSGNVKGNLKSSPIAPSVPPINPRSNSGIGQQPPPIPSKVMNVQDSKSKNNVESSKKGKESKNIQADNAIPNIEPELESKPIDSKKLAEAPRQPEARPAPKVQNNFKESPMQDQISKDQESVKNEDKKKEFVEKDVAEEFLKRLEEQQEHQKKILQEQKEILEELKQHHAQDVREKIENERKSDNKEKSEDNLNGGENEVLKENSKSKIPAPVPAQPKDKVDHQDKLIQKQAEIIEKISKTLEKEKKSVKALEKLEENFEGKLMDAKANVVESKIPPSPVESVPEVVRKDSHSQMGEGMNSQDKPASLPSNDAMNNIDKERGVLVGSLGGVAKKNSQVDADLTGNQNGLPPSPEVKQAQRQHPKVENTNNQESLSKIDNQENSFSNKVSDAIKENNQNLNIQPNVEEKNNIHSPLQSANVQPSPLPSKKTVSEAAVKDKVDREI